MNKWEVRNYLDTKIRLYYGPHVISYNDNDSFRRYINHNHNDNMIIITFLDLYLSEREIDPIYVIDLRTFRPTYDAEHMLYYIQQYEHFTVPKDAIDDFIDSLFDDLYPRRIY